ALAPGAAAPQPAQTDQLGTDGQDLTAVASTSPRDASLPGGALRRQDLRQEPSAVVPHAGICAGGRPQGRSLPRLPGGARLIKALTWWFSPYQSFFHVHSGRLCAPCVLRSQSTVRVAGGLGGPAG